MRRLSLWICMLLALTLGPWPTVARANEKTKILVPEARDRFNGESSCASGNPSADFSCDNGDAVQGETPIRVQRHRRSSGRPASPFLL
jgi:hypothetical protein